jgi:hypothetical protein
MEKQTSRELTFGEKAVGLTFNPSGDEKVNKAKQLMSDALDLLKEAESEKAKLSVGNAIKIMETTFLDRLKTEKDELLDKVSKLSIFLAKEGYNQTVSEANYLLLGKQLEAMNTYLNILIIRIELLEK